MTGFVLIRHIQVVAELVHEGRVAVGDGHEKFIAVVPMVCFAADKMAGEQQRRLLELRSEMSESVMGDQSVVVDPEAKLWR